MLKERLKCFFLVFFLVSVFVIGELKKPGSRSALGSSTSDLGSLASEDLGQENRDPQFLAPGKPAPRGKRELR
jgi:hypothetical protein